ncbi:MAG: hypothetical protein ACREQM_20285 [Candidatus Dormibacteraceae bacterium]
MEERDRYWVRIGGGLLESPGGRRYGPADAAHPPPGGPWQALEEGGVLLGWTSGEATPRAISFVREEAQRLQGAERAHLLQRLGHKLRSSVLALQECARQAAFGRPELLQQVYDEAQDVARRAAAVEAAALEPQDPARAVVLGAVLNLSAPDARRELPADAVVRGSEPVLVQALTRACDWVGGGQPVLIQGQRVGAWWRLQISSEQEPPAHSSIAEYGEPLVRLLVEDQLGGWLDTAAFPEGPIVVYLPAA